MPDRAAYRSRPHISLEPPVGLQPPSAQAGYRSAPPISPASMSVRAVHHSRPHRAVVAGTRQVQLNPQRTAATAAVLAVYARLRLVSITVDSTDRRDGARESSGVGSRPPCRRSTHTCHAHEPGSLPRMYRNRPPSPWKSGLTRCPRLSLGCDYSTSKTNQSSSYSVEGGTPIFDRYWYMPGGAAGGTS